MDSDRTGASHPSPANARVRVRFSICVSALERPSQDLIEWHDEPFRSGPPRSEPSESHERAGSGALLNLRERLERASQELIERHPGGLEQH